MKKIALVFSMIMLLCLAACSADNTVQPPEKTDLPDSSEIVQQENNTMEQIELSDVEQFYLEVGEGSIKGRVYKIITDEYTSFDITMYSLTENSWVPSEWFHSQIEKEALLVVEYTELPSVNISSKSGSGVRHQWNDQENKSQFDSFTWDESDQRKFEIKAEETKAEAKEEIKEEIAQEIEAAKEEPIVLEQEKEVKPQRDIYEELKKVSKRENREEEIKPQNPRLDKQNALLDEILTNREKPVKTKAEERANPFKAQNAESGAVREVVINLSRDEEKKGGSYYDVFKDDSL